MKMNSIILPVEPHLNQPFLTPAWEDRSEEEQERRIEWTRDSAEPDEAETCPECGSPLVPDSFVDPYGHRIGETAVCNGCGYTEAN
jgi:hypothetical protein